MFDQAVHPPDFICFMSFRCQSTQLDELSAMVPIS
jgi:hypothetical protein